MKILQKDEKTLRQTAKPVDLNDINTPKIKKVLKDMSEALKNAKDGVALAAPQIGVSLRIFIVSNKIFEEEGEDMVFINPKIIKIAKKKIEMDEGCLSVKNVYGKTKRSNKATVEAYDENGDRFSWNGSGLMAQIFQHEIDHLDGVLFIDHATNLSESK